MSVILCTFSCIFLGLFALSFGQAPTVDFHLPANNTVVPIHQSVTLKFNVPMNTVETEKEFTFVAAGILWNEEKDNFTATPTAALDYGTRYNVVLANATSATGEFMAEAFSFSFTTYVLPSIVTYTPANNTDISLTQIVVLTFSTAMNTVDTEAAVSVTNGGTFTAPTWTVGNTVVSLQLAGLADSSSYVVHVSTAARSVDGVNLAAPFEVHYKTPTPPTVPVLVSTAPVFGELRVSRALAHVVATYDVVMDGATFNVTMFPTLMPTTIVAGVASSAAHSATVQWNVTGGALSPLTNYTMVIHCTSAAGVQAPPHTGTFRTAGHANGPTVVMIMPAPNSTVTPYLPAVVLQFSEMMSTAVTQGAFSTNPNLPTHTFAWDVSQTQLTVTTNGDALNADVRFDVKVSTAARNVDDTPMTNDYDAHFFTFPIPRGINSYPANDEPNVPLTITHVNVTFSVPMNTNPTGVSLTLTQLHGAGVPGTVTWSPAGDVATFTFTGPLALTHYYVINATGHSANGVPMTPFSATFLTEGNAGGPKIVFTEPANDTRVLPDTTPIVIRFDSGMNRASVETAFSIFPAVDFTTVWTDGATFVATPTPYLAENTFYRVQIDKQAKDNAGRELAETYHFFFTTFAVPAIVPGSNHPTGTNVSLTTATSVASFNMNMTAGTVVHTVTDLAEGEEIGTAEYADPVTTNTFGQLLSEVTVYEVVIFGLSYPDRVPMRGNFNYTFTTTGTSAPRVEDWVPNVHTKVPVGTVVSLTFSQAMATDVASTDIALLAHGNPVAGNGVWLPGSKTWEFTATGGLEGFTNYTIRAVGRNVHGTPMADTFAFGFRTVGVIAVTSVLPANNTNSDSLTGPVVVAFSHPVVADSVTTRFGLYRKNHTQRINVTASTTDSTEFSFHPVEALAMDEQYVIYVDQNVTDADDTLMEAPFVSYFGTAPAPAPIPSPPEEGSSGLGGGAIAGIIIGVVGGLAIVGGLVWYFKFRKSKAKDYDALP